MLIKNAQVIDGTGQPAYPADIAITGDRITGVFKSAWPGEWGEVVDARGLTVMPGLIDPHSHADLLLPLPPAKQAELLRGKLAQGITTTIIGNCGLGCAPLANAETEAILRGLNAWMTPQQVAWNWRTTGDYLDRIAANGVALNIATLAPHGPIRIAAMGLAKGKPSRRQLKQMRVLLEQSLRDGALGLSTGLIYPPGMYAGTAELTALAEVVAAHGGIYTSHIRGSSELLLPAVKELLDVGRATGVRIHHSHNEAVGRAHWPKIARVLALEEQAEREGLRLSFDMFPYTAAATMMIALYPPWALEGGVDCLLERLQDAPTRRRMERDIERVRPTWKNQAWPHNLVRATGWDAIRIGYVASRRHKRYENRSLLELARLTGQPPFDAISDLIVAERGQVSMLIFEVSGEREQRDLLGQFVRHRLCAFCTDAEEYGRGLPHPAAYGALARILSQFVRVDKVLTLAEAVRKMTSYPAAIFGLAERGVIRPGAFADLLICDPARVRDRATFEKPRQLAAGIETVLVNGQIAFARGEAQPRLAGAVLRRARA